MSIESDKFNKLAGSWWDLEGPVGALHKFNTLRVPFLLDSLSSKYEDISKLKFLDIGCGGGILSEGLYDSGAINITGIDLAEDSIQIAKQHAEERGKNISYSAVDIANVTGKFDVIVCSEVLEHVDNPAEMIFHIKSILSDSGTIFISTINKTIKALFEAILAPEYLLNFVEKGTHHFSKLIKPETIIENFARNEKWQFKIQGFSYCPVSKDFYLRSNYDSNYFMIITKQDL